MPRLTLLRALAISASLGIGLSSARAQGATPDTATDYLVRITQRWGASAPIGALPDRSMSANDVELRVWGGYGLGGTRGVILRRTGDRWQAWRARVVRCVIDASTVRLDEASPGREAVLLAEARRHCPRTAHNYGSFYSVDTLALENVDARKAAPTWDRVLRAGVLELPPELPNRRIMIDVFGIVIEVRRGDVYRASHFHAVRPPEMAADSAARFIYRTVSDEFAAPRER